MSKVRQSSAVQNMQIRDSVFREILWLKYPVYIYDAGSEFTHCHARHPDIIRLALKCARLVERKDSALERSGCPVVLL